MKKRTLGGLGKNEPKTNPNEPKFKKAKMNVNKVLTKAYENKPPLPARKNKPKQTQSQNRSQIFKVLTKADVMSKLIFRFQMRLLLGISDIVFWEDKS